MLDEKERAHFYSGNYYFCTYVSTASILTLEREYVPDAATVATVISIELEGYHNGSLRRRRKTRTSYPRLSQQFPPKRAEK